MPLLFLVLGLVLPASAASRRGTRSSELMIMGPLQLQLLLLCSSGLFNLIQASSLALNDLSPPPGNSLQMKVKAYNGKQTFDCVQGKWKLINAEALLVDASNKSSSNLTTSVVGSYAFQNDGPLPLNTWSLYNSPEEYTESGSPASLVSGTKIAIQEMEAGCPNILIEATSHQYLGIASLVSYVQWFFTKAAERPPEGHCDSSSSSSREVPLEAEYWIWHQDKVPPPETPQELQVPLGSRLLEGFYGKGQVPFVFNGTSWIQRPWSALLYDVPGGTLVGIHYVRPGNCTSLVWELFDPNGWGVNGTLASEPIQVAENCMAWSLNLITSNWGNASLWGPFTYVQMLSTRGGMPPASPLASSSSPLMPSSPRPSPGDVYNSTFSAVFWFYVKVD